MRVEREYVNLQALIPIRKVACKHTGFDVIIKKDGGEKGNKGVLSITFKHPTMVGFQYCKPMFSPDGKRLYFQMILSNKTEGAYKLSNSKTSSNFRTQINGVKTGGYFATNISHSNCESPIFYITLYSNLKERERDDSV